MGQYLISKEFNGKDVRLVFVELFMPKKIKYIIALTELTNDYWCFWLVY